MNSRLAIIVALVVAAAVGVVVMTLFAASGPGGGGRNAVVPVVLIAVVVGAVLAVVVAVSASRGRRRRKKKSKTTSEKESEAARLGLAYRASADSDFHHDFGPLPGIPRGGNVKHVYTGTLEGRPVTAFQHSYVINTGQAVIPVYHTAYVTDAPEWPSLTISRRRLLGRVLHRLGYHGGLQLEDPVFNATIKIKTDDEDFALTLLHPDMQQFIAEKPTAVWRIHAGCCALIYSGALRSERMEASLDRLRRFWALVPDELSAW